MLRHLLLSQALGILALSGPTLLASCSSDSNDAANAPTVGGTPTGGNGGSAGAPVEAPTLRFFLDEDLDVSIEEQALFPEQILDIGVQAVPPDAYRVRFSLVSLDGAPAHDGSLDRTDAATDPSTGIAHVTLRAPSVVTQFNLQASIGSMSTAELRLNVQSQGWAELQVIPQYDGNREVTEWVANAYLKVRCEEVALVTDLDRGLPADTQYAAKAVFGIPPRLEVPVQPNMAITMRAGHYLFGCTNIDQPRTQDLTTVQVILANVPTQLNDVSLDVHLGVQETTDEWLARLQTAADDAVIAFTGGSDNDLDLVLEAMASLLDPGDRDFFQTASEAEDFEARALPSLAGMDNHALRNGLASWLSMGATALSTEAAFSGTLRSPATADGTAELTLDEVAGVDAERAGFEPSVSTTWSADPDDTVALGTTLRWSPSALVSALAEAQATAEHPEADDLSQAFAALIDCQVLADALAADGDAAYVFGECDRACAEALCQDALDELEKRLWSASDEEEELQLSATGAALVDDEARVLSFAGTWRGTFAMGESSAVGGAISGAETEDPAE